MGLLKVVKAYDLNLLEDMARSSSSLSQDFLEDNIETIRINPKNICVTRGVDHIKYLNNLRDKGSWSYVTMADGSSYLINVQPEELDTW